MKNSFKTKRIFVLSALMFLTAHTAWGVPARPGLRACPDGDGGIIMVELCGDENAHYYRSADGYMLMRHDDGSFRYAMTDNTTGKVVASEVKAHNVELRTETERQFLTTIDRERVRVAYDLMQRLKTKRYTTAPTTVAGNDMLDQEYPTTGSPRSLVVLVEYTDVKFTKENPNQLFKDMFNKEDFDVDGATGSILKYFKDCSNGQFTPQFDVYGPVTLAHDMSYYGGNDTYGDDMRPHKMAVEACQQLDDEIDFSVYDTDGDGIIDNIYIFYAGYSEASFGSPESVWPHSWYVNKGAKETHYFDGKLLDGYATSNELFYGDRLDGIGTFCHEFGHVLGLPDLYSTSYTSSFTPGAWDIMDIGCYNNNGHTPPYYSGYECYCMGWIKPKVLTNPCDVTIQHLSPETQYDNVYIIPTESDNEFYLLENRQRIEWDTYLPWHGMLVWHIDYDKEIWHENTVNVNKQYIDLIEADNYKSNLTRLGNPFPGTSNITQFTDDTTPSMCSWSGKALYAPITDITETFGIISFKFRGGAENKLNSLQAKEASDVNKTSFKARWNPADSISEYLLNVYTKKEDGSRLYVPEYMAMAVTEDNEVTVTGLKNNTTYYYVVQAMRNGFFSDESNEIEVTTTDPALGIRPATNTGKETISVNGRCITIETDSAADIFIYDMAGRRLHSAKGSVGLSSFTLIPGIYVVKAGNTTRKVTVGL